MMAQRIKGQEVTVTVISPNGPERSLGDVQSFEIEPMLEVLSEGYLGETTERKDDIFKGVSGSMEINLEQTDFFVFQNAIIERSQRRIPAANVISVNATLAFPDGTFQNILMEDVFFGATPMSVGSREDYVSVSLDFECSEVQYI